METGRQRNINRQEVTITDIETGSQIETSTSMRKHPQTTERQTHRQTGGDTDRYGEQHKDNHVSRQEVTPTDM